MKIVILHSADALEPPVDPVLAQIADALEGAGHETEFQVVLSDVVALATALRAAEPELVVNLAEAFDGKSALESNVAALLNLLDLRYTGSSPAGLMLAGDKALSKKVLSFHGVRSPQFATVHRGDVEWAGDLSLSADRQAAAGRCVDRDHPRLRRQQRAGAARSKWERCRAAFINRLSSSSSSTDVSFTWA